MSHFNTAYLLISLRTILFGMAIYAYTTDRRGITFDLYYRYVPARNKI